MSDATHPMITTIIPTYRRPEKLRRAVASVLNQSYPSFQVHVYDNASGDETEEVVAELSGKDPRVKYHCRTKNVGVFDNFNLAVNAVKTPFFSILSDDDVLLPGFFQTAMDELEKYQAAAFCGCTTITMTEDGKVLGATSFPSEGYCTPPAGMLKMIKNNLTWTSVLFRREVTDEVGGLDHGAGAPFDLDFLLRIAARHPFVISQRPAAIWVNHPESSCASNDSSFLWPGWLKIVRNLSEDERIPIEARLQAEQILMNQLRRNLFWAGANSIRLKNYDDAYRVAVIIREHYNLTAKARLLFMVAWCCENIPLAHPLLLLLNRLRKTSRLKRERELQGKFGKYSSFLKQS